MGSMTGSMTGRALTGLALAALLAGGVGCAIDTSGGDASVAVRQITRAAHGIGVSPVTHSGAGFTALLPAGPGWSVVELPGRLLALELGVQTPVTMVVSVRSQRSLGELEESWRDALVGKGFRIVDRLETPSGVVLVAEGDEAVSGRSVDAVVLRELPDGRRVQCSVGVPVAAGRTWVRAIREICDTVKAA